jgi:hypothetical protein
LLDDQCKVTQERSVTPAPSAGVSSRVIAIDQQEGCVRSVTAARSCLKEQSGDGRRDCCSVTDGVVRQTGAASCRYSSSGPGEIFEPVDAAARPAIAVVPAARPGTLMLPLRRSTGESGNQWFRKPGELASVPLADARALRSLSRCEAGPAVMAWAIGNAHRVEIRGWRKGQEWPGPARARDP